MVTFRSTVSNHGAGFTASHRDERATSWSSSHTTPEFNSASQQFKNEDLLHVGGQGTE